MKLKNLIIKAAISLAIMGTSTSYAFASDTAVKPEPVRRVVVKTPVKRNLLSSNYINLENKYLVTAYGAQTSAVKVIRPTVKKTRTPNHYSNSSK